MTGINVIPCDASAEGHLIYINIGGGAFPRLNVYSSVDRKSAQFAKFGAEAQFSPDGKWIAYVGMPEQEILARRLSSPRSSYPDINRTWVNAATLGPRR